MMNVDAVGPGIWSLPFPSDTSIEMNKSGPTGVKSCQPRGKAVARRAKVAKSPLDKSKQRGYERKSRAKKKVRNGDCAGSGQLLSTDTSLSTRTRESRAARSSSGLRTRSTGYCSLAQRSL